MSLKHLNTTLAPVALPKPMDSEESMYVVILKALGNSVGNSPTPLERAFIASTRKALRTRPRAGTENAGRLLFAVECLRYSGALPQRKEGQPL